jgi:hypothetical protein
MTNVACATNRVSWMTDAFALLLGVCSFVIDGELVARAR